MTDETEQSTEPSRLKSDLKARLDAVPVSSDVVAYMLDCWLALAPRTSAAMLQAVERQVRENFGGDKAWIFGVYAQSLQERNAKIRQDHAKGERIELLMRRYELSKRRLFQIVSEKSPKE